MAVGLPLKTTYADGDVYSASDVNDTNGTVNLFTSSTLSVAAGKNAAIINGGMDVWQRGTSFAPTAAAYLADRWQGGRGGAVGGNTYSRQLTNDTTNLPFIQYAMRVQRDSGNTSTQSLFLAQSIENANSTIFIGRAVTLSFYARKGANYSATSSALSFSLRSGTGTDQNFLTSSPTGLATVISSTATLTTTWQRFTATATVGATAKQLGLILTSVPTGTAGADDWYEITGVQLELGSVATSFARNGAGGIQGELAACQRYYFRASVGSIGNAIATSTTAFEGNLPLPVAMRITPATLDSSATRLSDGVTVTNTTALSLNAGNSSVTNVYLTGTVASGLTQYRPYFFSANAGYYGLSAEL
jgi:hypothetical protein